MVKTQYPPIVDGAQDGAAQSRCTGKLLRQHTRRQGNLAARGLRRGLRTAVAR